MPSHQVWIKQNKTNKNNSNNKKKQNKGLLMMWLLMKKFYKVEIVSRLCLIVPFWTSDSSSVDLWKGWIPDCCFQRRSWFQDPTFWKPDFLPWRRPYLICSLRLSFSCCIVTISLITRPRIRMLNLKKKIDPCEPHESFS